MKEEFKKLDEWNEKAFVRADKQLIAHYKKAYKEAKLVLMEMDGEYRLNGELSVSEIYRYNRFRQLRQALLGVLISEGHYEEEIMATVLVDVYVENQLKSAYILEETIKDVIGVERIDVEAVKVASTTFIGGATLHEVLEEGTLKFVRELQDEIVQGFILNESYKEMTGRIQNKFNLRVESSRRIIRSEGTRIINTARNESYKLAEAKGIALKKEWIASLDSRTRKSHQRLDGTIIGVDEYFQIGSKRAKTPGNFGDKSEDYNCRCTIAPVIEDDIEVTRNDGRKEFKHLPYSEWEKKYK